MLILKNIFLPIFAFFLLLPFFSVDAQSPIINGINIIPETPTDLDSITIYIDQSFAYSSCDLFEKSIQINGDSITSSSHHCIGMLTAICTTIDTFLLAPLTTGVYNLTHRVSVGSHPEPCVSGSNTEEMGTFQFEVMGTSLNNIYNSLKAFKIFPNPTVDNIFIENDNLSTNFNVVVLNLQGLPLISSNSSQISLESLKKGTYILIISYMNRVEQFKVVKQ